jgi:hypothetical protein
MCEKCNRTAALIEQTHGTGSVVAFSFPNGEPRLLSRLPEDQPEECPDCGKIHARTADDVACFPAFKARMDAR